jgi:hypothetical protein
MNRSLANNFFAATLTLMLAIGIFSLPKPAAAGCCVVSGMATSDSCSVDGKCIAGIAGVPTEGTCDLALTSCSSSTGTGGTGGTTSTTAPGSSAGALTNPLSGVCNSVKSDDPDAGKKCMQLVIGNVIKTGLGIVGSIALLMITWGGFLWLTAMGNESRVEKGKETLIWSTIGLVVIFSAYAIASYVIEKLVAGK